MDRSAPFTQEAAILREVAQGDSVIATALTLLPESTARKGVKTLAQLQSSFDELVPETRRAALIPEGGGPIWWGFAYVLDQMKFKQKGQVPGDACDDILTRADDYVKRGDLAHALKEVDRIHGVPGQVMVEWVGAAKERLAAEQAIALINAHAACVAAQVT